MPLNEPSTGIYLLLAVHLTSEENVFHWGLAAWSELPDDATQLPISQIVLIKNERNEEFWLRCTRTVALSTINNLLGFILLPLPTEFPGNLSDMQAILAEWQLLPGDVSDAKIESGIDWVVDVLEENAEQWGMDLGLEGNHIFSHGTLLSMKLRTARYSNTRPATVIHRRGVNIINWNAFDQ